MPVVHFPLLSQLISFPVTDVFVAQIQMRLISETISHPLGVGGYELLTLTVV